MIWNKICEHFLMVVVAILYAIIIGIFLGILAYKFPKAKKYIIGIVDVFQTVPALALLGIIMIFCGAGKVTVIIGITLYSLLPVVQNTCTGLENIDPAIRESAKGMGMSSFQRLWKVELSLAMPVIITGIRIALVNAIGIAVFSAYVGGGGLGSLIINGIRTSDTKSILVGTICLCGMAILLDFLLGKVEKMVIKKNASVVKYLISIVGLSIVVLLAINFFSPQNDANGLTIRMHNGDYSETQIMCQMAKLLIEDKTDANVVIQEEMSPINIFRALVGDNNSCELMISYDGTMLTTFFGLDPRDVPEGQSLYDFTNQIAKEKYQIHMYDKLGYNNTYSIAVKKELADKYHLETISDLKSVAGELVFGAEHNFFTQDGTMKYGPFIAYYGLEFKNAVSIDNSLKYAAVEAGEFDVVEVYATDGLNKKAKLKILKDDKAFFPEYNGAYVIRDDMELLCKESGIEIDKVLNELAGKLSNETMTELTYQADVEKKPINAVAYDFLKNNGYISGF